MSEKFRFSDFIDCDKVMLDTEDDVMNLTDSGFLDDTVRSIEELASMIACIRALNVSFEMPLFEKERLSEIVAHALHVDDAMIPLTKLLSEEVDKAELRKARESARVEQLSERVEKTASAVSLMRDSFRRGEITPYEFFDAVRTVIAGDE